MTKIIARFTPQAWIRNYATEVDPEGDTLWDATESWMSLPAKYRGLLLDEIKDDGYEALDREDALRGDPNAPEWIRDWHGPFDIHVHIEDDE